MQKTAIWITLSPSKIEHGWHLFSHVSPLLFLMGYTLPLLFEPSAPMATGIFLLIACCGLFGLSGYWTYPTAHVIELLSYDQGCWYLKKKDGTAQRALLFRKTLLADVLIWLYFIDEKGQEHKLHIWPDSAPPEARRQLRVLLRLTSG